MRRRSLAFSLPAILAAPRVNAQAWPSRSVRIIVAFSAATTSDLLGRLVAQKLGERMGVSFVVENQAGAGGTIGAAAAARAPADGYTLFLSTTALVIAPRLFRSVPFRPMEDFAPVGTIGYSPNVLVTGPRVAIGSVAELIAAAKREPGRLRYASSGPGSGSWLSMELLKAMTGIELEEIPYSSTAQATTDTMSGQIELHCPSLAGATPTLRAGQLRALGVTGGRRSPSAPEIPSIAETVPGYDASGWYGLSAPANAPEPVLARLSVELQAMLADAQVRAALAGVGVDSEPGTPAQMTETMVANTRRWTELMDRIGFRPQ
jgi:tripartite-type tricarboxylate transporter receptor subunit TctC